MGPQSKARNGRISLTRVLFPVFLLGLFWITFPAAADAQAKGRMFQIGQTNTRSERLQQRDQEQRQRRLLEKNQELLRQQTEIQRTIPLVEQELKKPLSPDDYTAKKCELEELATKQQQIGRQLKTNQQELARIQQELARSRQELSRMPQRERVTAARQRPSPRERSRHAQETPQQQSRQQAWQQQALLLWQQQAQAQSQAQVRNCPDRLTQIMNSPTNPLSGIPSPLLEARRLASLQDPPFATRRVLGPVTFTSTGTELFFELPFDAQLSAAEANSATRIIVTFTISGDTLDQGFQLGLKGSPPVTRYFSGSSMFSAGAGSNGVHLFRLTPSQFTTPVTDFVFGFSNIPSTGSQFTISQMRVDFFR